MAKLGATARGVAVVDTTVTDAELKWLNELGVRGIRFNLVQSGATTIDVLEPLSKRVNDLGWHVQIHTLGDEIVETADLLQRPPSRPRRGRPCAPARWSGNSAGHLVAGG